MAEDNPFDIQEPSANSSTMERMVSMAKEVVDTEQLVGELEENLDSIKKRLNHLKTKEMPDLMAEVGVTEVALENGTKVQVKDFVAGSLPKDPSAREKAIAWVVEHDGEDTVRTTLTIEFEKREHNSAMALSDDLRKQGFEPVVQSGIHPQTLLSLVREMLEEGTEVPLDTLGLYAGRTTKVIAPKAKKEKANGKR